MICYLGLGSNLGNRKKYIKSAFSMLKALKDTEILDTSEMIETEPVGFLEQPDFINCIIKISTKLDAGKLLNETTRIENELDRKRDIRWGPRTIDIDILFFGESIIDKPYLTIPHPELHKRKFILDSMMELDPELKHPVLKKTIKEIYKELSL